MIEIAGVDAVRPTDMAVWKPPIRCNCALRSAATWRFGNRQNAETALYASSAASTWSGRVRTEIRPIKSHFQFMVFITKNFFGI